MNREISTTVVDYFLAYVTDSDLIVRSASIAGSLIFVLSIILFIQVLNLRFRSIRYYKRKNSSQVYWRKLLTHALVGENFQLPALPKKELFFFLEEWNQLFNKLRGASIQQLVHGAYLLGVHKQAVRLLDSGKLSEQLTGIITLGNLQEASVWHQLVELTDSPNTLVSLTAARALIQINASEGIKVILPMLEHRPDWPWSSIAQILRIAPPTSLCQPLGELAKSSLPALQVDLLRYIETTNCNAFTDATAHILRDSSEDKVISVCLHILSNPREIELARQHLAHPRWHVRMHAASALGRLGTRDDIPALLKMVCDNEWWVRYRAAQALQARPFISNQQLRDFRDKLDDNYGRDILTQVIHESEGKT